MEDQEIIVDVLDPSVAELFEGKVLLYFSPEKIDIIANV